MFFRKDRDWGLYQLDTVRDRKEIKGLLPFVLILFGDHTLHHMFPTVDHAYLYPLYPILEETCKEFNIDFQLTTITDLIVGQFKQLSRITKKKLYKCEWIIISNMQRLWSVHLTVTFTKFAVYFRYKNVWKIVPSEYCFYFYNKFMMVLQIIKGVK